MVLMGGEKTKKLCFCLQFLGVFWVKKHIIIFFFAGNDETLKLIKNAGGKAFGYVVDLTDKEAIYKAAIQIKNEVGRVKFVLFSI